MRNKERFYRCKNCLMEFSEISDDKKCVNCGSDKIEIVRIINADNVEETEIKRDI